MNRIKITREEYERLKRMDLDTKITLSMDKIVDFYEYFNGNVHVSFSGGKDSTALLHLVRSIYPNVKGVFVNTGLEFPEIVEFVKSVPNVEILKPKKTFYEVIKNEGYPIISKKIARQIRTIRNVTSNNEATRRLYLDGIRKDGTKTKFFKLPNKWRFLINAPFKISEKCCDILKKQPLFEYERKTGSKPIVGVMASDSLYRQNVYLRYGCNSFEKGKAISRPLSFWTTEDVWQYIKENKIPYCKIYDMGEHNTGCIYCMFGVHLEKEPNRFQRLKKIHPKLWEYCIFKLNLKQCLDYIGVKYE